MSTTVAPERSHEPATDRARAWITLVAIAAAIIAVVDVVFMALIAEIVPFLAVAAIATVVGLGLLRSRRRIALVVLALTTVVMIAGGIPFAVDHLGHPDSGLDWAHAVIGLFGRVFLLGVLLSAWRASSADRGASRSPHAARVTGVVGLGLLGIVATVAIVATAVTSGDDRRPGDVLLTIDATAFPDEVVVASGDVLFVDNRHVFRHTFTVTGTDIDVQLPALQGIRIPIDLPPGTYELICDVPGHDDMVGTLIVE